MGDYPALTALSEEQRGQALERFAVLRPFLEEGVPLTAVAQAQDLSVRTLRYWVRQYREQGLAGLVRRPRSDRGRHHLPDALVDVIEGLALRRPAPSVASIQRQAAVVARAQGWSVPGYACVYAIVRRLDPALVTLAHEGTKAYKETYDLLYRHEAAGPNETWQADHTPLDLWVLDEHGQPARPWLTVILDDYSRAVAGYSLSLHAPSALQTALALRQAIWHKADAHWRVCGIPGVFYTDHGSDFTSRHLEQVAADIEMRLIFSEKGEPRGRGKIERFFETVNQLFLCELPGYTPPGTAPATPTLTVPELDERLQHFVVETYHQRTHGETGQAPLTRWEAAGFLPCLPESLEKLDLLLLTVPKPRQVHQDGIHLHGLRYIDLTLAAYVGEDVVVRYDPRDMAEVRVYHQGRFLCRAICQELADQSVSLKDIIRARTERRRQLRAGLSEREALVEALLAVHRPPPEPAPPAAPVTEPAAPPLKRYYNE
jgi:putative transposase